MSCSTICPDSGALPARAGLAEPLWSALRRWGSPVQGEVVWLVATDPAAKVGQVIATGIGIHVAPNAVMSGLMALEIDPEHAAAEYRGGIVGPMCEVVKEMAWNGIKEQLSGACTTKIAAFEEVAGLDARCRAMPDSGSALGPRRRPVWCRSPARACPPQTRNCLSS